LPISLFPHSPTLPPQSADQAQEASMTDTQTPPADKLRDERITPADPTLPMTGDEYVESLKDDREVWIYGERVEDVTTHPAFRNSIRMIARLYDALHDPATSDKLLVPTDTGNGGMTHPFFKVARSVAALRSARTAIETR